MEFEKILSDNIQNVCPIENIYILSDGIIEIVFKNPDISSVEQKEKAYELIKKWPLEKAKLKKINQLNLEYENLILDGWDCGQGKLGMTASDVALLAGAFTLAKEAAVFGLPIPPIITKEDNQINFASIQEMTALLLQYGAARSLMSAEFAARRRAVHEATTAEQLESI
jgi:hypothetical protein